MTKNLCCVEPDILKILRMATPASSPAPRPLPSKPVSAPARYRNSRKSWIL